MGIFDKGTNLVSLLRPFGYTGEQHYGFRSGTPSYFRSTFKRGLSSIPSTTPLSFKRKTISRYPSKLVYPRFRKSGTGLRQKLPKTEKWTHLLVLLLCVFLDACPMSGSLLLCMLSSARRRRPESICNKAQPTGPSSLSAPRSSNGILSGTTGQTQSASCSFNIPLPITRGKETR